MINCPKLWGENVSGMIPPPLPEFGPLTSTDSGRCLEDAFRQALRAERRCPATANTRRSAFQLRQKQDSLRFPSRKVQHFEDLLREVEKLGAASVGAGGRARRG